MLNNEKSANKNERNQQTKRGLANAGPFVLHYFHAERGKGPVAKAKTNASQGIPELVQIATNESYQENTKKKHATDVKYGWYRYDVRFALPVYDDKTGKLARYNIYSARLLVRHAKDGKKYLYDFLSIKKEASSPLE